MELLKRLCDAPGVSGHEDKVGEIIMQEASSFTDSVEVDHLGNLYMTKRQGKKGPHVMFAAHTDEVGLMVERADEQGFIKFLSVGGIDPRVLPGKRVRVGSEAIPGVIGMKPYHLSSEAERGEVIDIKDLRVDIGASSKTQAVKYCEPGTVMWFDTELSQHGDILKAKAFDDRAGCYMLVELARHRFDFPVTFAWTVQEEVGLRGGRLATARVMPDIIIVLEGTGAGDVPPVRDSTRIPYLGKGPVITIMDWSVVCTEKMLALLVDTASENDIPYQLKRPFIGGTDAGAAIRVKALVTAVLAVPSRYIHSPVALAHRKDIMNTLELVKAACGRIKEVKW